ncbi:hypothetical protein [Rugamonas sp. DEMB1]|uniref:hypothetical protein n=1 Tax=Rugamonas sp. DEMB1 TaxID=3039386 RepID=UPI0028BE2EA2|nr:hypothetical protein [Rugamonas sp. DEMB1]
MVLPAVPTSRPESRFSVLDFRYQSGLVAGAVGAVEHQRLVLVEEVDAARLALGVVELHAVGRLQHIALAGVEVELELVAGEVVAEAPDAHVAVGLDLVLDLAVAGRVGLDPGLVLDDLDVALERDLALGAAADVLGAHGGDGVLVLHPGRPRLGLGVAGRRRGGEQGGQGIGPSVQLGGGSWPAHTAHEKRNRNTMTGDFLI